VETGIYELVEKILFGVSFIAVGGTVSLVFFFVFAPNILGSRATHRQLERLEQQTEQMNQRLKEISRLLEGGRDRPK
jgi:hypothetical protein